MLTTYIRLLKVTHGQLTVLADEIGFEIYSDVDARKRFYDHFEQIVRHFYHVTFVFVSPCLSQSRSAQRLLTFWDKFDPWRVAFKHALNGSPCQQPDDHRYRFRTESWFNENETGICGDGFPKEAKKVVCDLIDEIAIEITDLQSTVEVLTKEASELTRSNFQNPK